MEMLTADKKVFEFDKPIYVLEKGKRELKYLEYGIPSRYWNMIDGQEYTKPAGIFLRNFGGGILTSDQLFVDEIEGLTAFIVAVQYEIHQLLELTRNAHRRIEKLKTPIVSDLIFI